MPSYRTILSRTALVLAIGTHFLIAQAASEQGPVFGKKAAHISDVQIRLSHTEDKRTVTVLFDGMLVKLTDADKLVDHKIFSVVMPFEGAPKEATVNVEIRGTIDRESDTTGFILVRAGSEVLVAELNIMHGQLFRETKVRIRGGNSLPLTVAIGVERNMSSKANALLQVDSVELKMEPAK